MTTITIEKELLDRALESMCWAARILNIDPDEAPNYHWSLENIRSALAAPATAPEFPADWAQMIHYPECWDTAAYPELRDAIHEALAWSGCSVCKPATAPAWHVAPTVPGLWVCNYGALSVTAVNQPDIDAFDPAYNAGGRWFGPDRKSVV